MSRELLLVTILLASYALVSSMAGLLVMLVSKRVLIAPSTVSARDWFYLRLSPAIAGVAVSFGLVLPGFLFYEPLHDGENAGPLVLLLASLTLALMALSVLTLGRAVWTAWLFERLHLSTAPVAAIAGARLPVHVVERAGLLVGLVGVLRPRLVLSTHVRAACTEEELATITAHEAAHLGARDNLKRLLLDACPDVLRWTSAHQRLTFNWSAAAEAEADDAAAGSGNPGARIALAALLVKLARLAPAPMGLPPLSSPLIDRDDLAPRVRRLLDEPAQRRWQSGRRALKVAATCALLGFVWAWSAPDVLQSVHQVSEFFVRMGR